MSKKPYYITTAITYTSGKPHIGNTYEIILADSIARYKRMEGYDVFFQTGTDEHGQKVELKAEEKGVVRRLLRRTTGRRPRRDDPCGRRQRRQQRDFDDLPSAGIGSGYGKKLRPLGQYRNAAGRGFHPVGKRNVRFVRQRRPMEIPDRHVAGRRFHLGDVRTAVAGIDQCQRPYGLHARDWHRSRRNTRLRL